MIRIKSCHSEQEKHDKICKYALQCSWVSIFFIKLISPCSIHVPSERANNRKQLRIQLNLSGQRNINKSSKAKFRNYRFSRNVKQPPRYEQHSSFVDGDICKHNEMKTIFSICFFCHQKVRYRYDKPYYHRTLNQTCLFTEWYMLIWFFVMLHILNCCTMYIYIYIWIYILCVCVRLCACGIMWRLTVRFFYIALRFQNQLRPSHIHSNVSYKCSRWPHWL